MRLVIVEIFMGVDMDGTLMGVIDALEREDDQLARELVKGMSVLRRRQTSQLFSKIERMMWMEDK